MLYPSSKKTKMEGLRNHRLVRLNSVRAKIMAQVLLEHSSGGKRVKKVAGNSQHRLTVGESCQSQTVAFCNNIPVLVDKWRTADVLYLDTSMAFVTTYHNILSWDVIVWTGAQQKSWKKKKKGWII